MFLAGLCSWTMACAPSHHSVDPYRSNPQQAVRLESRAGRICQAHRAPDAAAPTRAFVTDGCSVWPDDPRYVDCCVEHDIFYWCGGTPEQRLAADDAFGECVAAASSSGLGSSLRLGVRIGGHPVIPVPWRWGYGDPYRGGYRDAAAN